MGHEILGEASKEIDIAEDANGTSKIFLHTCCAPCSVKCIEVLQEEGFEITAFWYNPNIHLWTEYKARRDTLVEYCKKQNIDVYMKDEYGLTSFIYEIYPNFDSTRCEICYKKRIEETAKQASSEGYSSFSTTLLISPYQNHDLICKIASAMAQKYEVEFKYIDFRPYFREGQRVARNMGLYMQKYCGCIFSEEERYSQRS